MRTWNNRKGQGAAHKWLVAHIGHAGEDCLIWPFHRDPDKGYGFLGHNGITYKAHRRMCELAHGPAPSSQHHAAHSCANGHLGCVHPGHLSWKTPEGNAEDRVNHGNNAGNRYGSRTRLPAETIADIQSKAMPQMAYATKYKIPRSVVQYWQYKGQPPAPPGTSISAIRHRAKSSATVGLD